MAYRCIGRFERGLVEAADSLTAIERLGFGANPVDLDAIVHSMRQDHPDEGLRQRMLDAPKCSSAHESLCRWLLWLLGSRTRILDEVGAGRGLLRHTPCLVVRSLHYVDGSSIGGTRGR